MFLGHRPGVQEHLAGEGASDISCVIFSYGPFFCSLPIQLAISPRKADEVDPVVEALAWCLEHENETLMVSALVESSLNACLQAFEDPKLLKKLGFRYFFVCFSLAIPWRFCYFSAVPPNTRIARKILRTGTNQNFLEPPTAGIFSKVLPVQMGGS